MKTIRELSEIKNRIAVPQVERTPEVEELRARLQPGAPPVVDLLFKISGARVAPGVGAVNIEYALLLLGPGNITQLATLLVCQPDGEQSVISYQANATSAKAGWGGQLGISVPAPYLGQPLQAILIGDYQENPGGEAQPFRFSSDIVTIPKE